MSVTPYVLWHRVGKQYLSRQGVNCLQAKRGNFKREPLQSCRASNIFADASLKQRGHRMFCDSG